MSFVTTYPLSDMKSSNHWSRHLKGQCCFWNPIIQIKSIFSIVRDYTYALDTLDSYDYQNLTISETTVPEKFHASYENAMEVITSLRGKFGQSDLFGVEKDQSFHSSIGQIYQTWDGKELYPSIEEKAAMLLYLIVKNHSFVDGNKRIAATLFLWFMQRNGILYRPDGAKRIADGTLVALTLMIFVGQTCNGGSNLPRVTQIENKIDLSHSCRAYFVKSPNICGKQESQCFMKSAFSMKL